MEESKYIDMFRKWVIQRGTEAYPVTENDEGNLEIESTEGLGRVNFYENNTVELLINTIPGDDVAFFLHFQLENESDFTRAKDLYYDLEKAMRDMKDNTVKKILLTCSSALTTSYFAEQLNVAAETLGYKYKFRAVSFDHIAESGAKEDAILLAPQVHYARQKVLDLFPNKIVINIPAQTFGSYDTGALITLVKGELDEKDRLETPKVKRTQAFFETNKKILTIGYSYDENNNATYKITSRYYKDGHIQSSDIFYKKNVNHEDMRAIIRECLNCYPEIEIVGIAIPGAIEGGVVTLSEEHPVHQVNIVEILQKEFQKPILLFNDANMIVTGIYWLEDRYKSLIFYYLPYHAAIAGVGVVVNGHMIRGKNHVVGEMKFMQGVLNLQHSPEELAETEEGNLDLISKSLIPMIIGVGPEAIFVYSYKLKDMNKLREEMKKHLDDEFIPDLLPLENVDEYMMTGTFLRCIWKDQDIQRRKFGLTHNPYAG